VKVVRELFKFFVIPGLYLKKKKRKKTIRRVLPQNPSQVAHLGLPLPQTKLRIMIGRR
jgi:predicted secreted protein